MHASSPFGFLCLLVCFLLLLPRAGRVCLTLTLNMEPNNDVGLVLEFLRNNGLRDAELALKEDIMEKNLNKEEEEEGKMGSFDFEMFLFDLPPVRIPANSTSRQAPPQEAEEEEGDGGGGGGFVGLNSGSVSEDEFVSLGGTSTTGGCSSEFINPYGLRSSSQANSETSSDRLSQFGTARDYPDFDMQNDLYGYDEKDEGEFMTPCFSGQDYFGYQSEDKFMTSKFGLEYENSNCLYNNSDRFELESNVDYLDKPCLFDTESLSNKVQAEVVSYYHFDNGNLPEGDSDWDKLDYIRASSKEIDLNALDLKLGDVFVDRDVAQVCSENKTAANYNFAELSEKQWVEESKSTSQVMPSGNGDYDVRDSQKDREAQGLTTDAEGENVQADELLINDSQEECFEVFSLRIIHRKNRTGFEASKELPIVLNTVLAGRYYVTEYLGSAAFSKVIQAHDLHTGIDICLKIIKNDKDFFDQSLDEIKLLKLVNKHDPADERHILRLYDYFYHQEHLFIVCELLKANLYEFQKFNQESGGETYFTLSRLQFITRQCLEALEYLHHLGIIHCDLKPENILIKSYRRCEIKVIDLGSSCFRSDNLCLYVQSRSYRAPEVILGLPYDEKIDLWSLGCILAELCSGEVLFPNDAVVMILARVIGMFGPIDMEMLLRGQEVHKYFSEEFDLYHMNEETDQLEYIIPEESSLEDHLQTSDAGFIDFVRILLEVNPQMRPTAAEALNHPWLSHSY